MTLFVTEYGNVQRQARMGPVINPTPLRSYAMTSAGSSGTTAGQIGAACQYVRVNAEAGMLLAISSSTGLAALTSTNSVRIPANAPPELFAVPPGFSLMAAST